MAGPGPERLVRIALRCYPERWRSRHGEEAAELARLLIRDGTPARSIAWSYVKGAARTRLVPQPRRRLGAAVGALVAVACSLGVSLALLSPSVPANAITGPCSGDGRGARTASHTPAPDRRPHYTAGGTARSSAAISIHVAPRKPANNNAKGSRGQHC
jgi:hypothetical protein